MSTEYDLHVNGPAIVRISSTLSGAFTRLGVTVDGPDVDTDANFEQVFGDDWGPFMPTDVQYFGEVATIRTEFIRWNETVMNSVEGRIVPTGAGAQVWADIGTLVREPTRIRSGQNYFRLEYESHARTSLPREYARRFHCVYPLGSIAFKPSTRVTRKTVTWFAIPNMLDGRLWDPVQVP